MKFQRDKNFTELHDKNCLCKRVLNADFSVDLSRKNLKWAFSFNRRPKRARRIREKQEKKEREERYKAESKLGIDNGVVYEQPPPYEFQTVSLDFDHDAEDGGMPNVQPVQPETPVFIDDNKVTSTMITLLALHGSPNLHIIRSYYKRNKK